MRFVENIKRGFRDLDERFKRFQGEVNRKYLYKWYDVWVEWLRKRDAKQSSFAIFFICSLIVAYLTIPSSVENTYPTDDRYIGMPLDHPIHADRDYTILQREKTLENRLKAQKGVLNRYTFIAAQDSDQTQVPKAFKLMRATARESIIQAMISTDAPIEPEYRGLVADYIMSLGKSSLYSGLKAGLPAAFAARREEFQTILNSWVDDTTFKLLSENLFPPSIDSAIESIASYINDNNYFVYREGLPEGYEPQDISVKKDFIMKSSRSKVISASSLLPEIIHIMKKTEIGSEFTPQGVELVAKLATIAIRDNIIFDSETTENEKINAQNSVPDVEKTIRNGELIKASGSQLTREDIEIFRAIREQTPTVSRVELWIQNLFYIWAVVALTFLVFQRSVSRFKFRNKDILLMSLQLVLAMLLFKQVIPFFEPFIQWKYATDTRILYFLIPIPFVVATVRILTNVETSCFFLIVLSALLLPLFRNNYYFPVYYTVSSLFFILIMRHVESYTDILKRFIWSIPFMVFLAMIIVWMDSSIERSNLQASILCSVGNAAFSSLFMVPVVMFYEFALEYVTNMKYINYSTMNNPLLKRLAVEANGTYQHSLNVANIVEIAARVLGINPLQCKVMAYFHDIGKLKDPKYFTENQHGTNPHDGKSYSLSAKIIMQHRDTGLEMARREHLGEEIESAVTEHHGTTTTYFYFKAKKDGIDVNQIDFRYKGPKPRSKETALLMFADSCEAAVRSIPDAERNAEKIEKMVEMILNGKNAENQFSECPMTMSDIEKARQSIVSTLQSFYHQRVQYK